MNLPINQIKKVEEKLRLYEKPFIEISLLQQILEKFAPNYEIKKLSSYWLISPISRADIYLNLLSPEKKRLISTTILAQYGRDKTYAVGWLYLYNQYHFSEQMADRVTVYNTSINGKRIIAWYKFIFRQVRSSFFRGIEEMDAQWYGIYKRMTRERALIQLIKDNDWKLEYSDDIYREIKTWKVSKDKILSLAKKHTSKQTQLLVEDFLEKWTK